MKKKIIALCLAVCLIAIAVIGGTLAYYTDTQTQRNTFTVGKVDITLDEAVVEKNAAGDLVAKGNERTSNDQGYHLFPGMVVTKDPTIKVAGDSEDAYIGAIIEIKGDVYDLLKVEGTDMIDINKVASGGLIGDALEATTWNGLTGHLTNKCFVYQVADKAHDTWTLYVYILDPQVKNSTVVLFDTLTIPGKWDHAEMSKLQNMTITVNAYATQTSGFAGVFDALGNAFDGVWPK